jgi:hypothetical protein
MKATMQSTSKTIILNGLNLRVWEGVSEKGVPFVALVNRLASSDPARQQLLVQETVAKHKDPEESTGPTLVTLGVG